MTCKQMIHQPAAAFCQPETQRIPAPSPRHMEAFNRSVATVERPGRLERYPSDTRRALPVAWHRRRYGGCSGSPSQCLDPRRLLERITYASPETGYTIARIGAEPMHPDLGVSPAWLDRARCEPAGRQPRSRPATQPRRARLTIRRLPCGLACTGWPGQPLRLVAAPRTSSPAALIQQPEPAG